MSDIWVVYGQTGEYSDHVEWLVCAYEDEALAVRHADLAARAAKKACDWMDEKCRDTSHAPSGQRSHHTRRYCTECHAALGAKMWEAPKHFLGKLDPQVSMDYTGADYVALKVPVRTALPEAK